MRAVPVRRAVRGGLKRRRVQTFVIGLVLLVSTGASVLALGLLVDSSAPFDHAFAAQRGAHAELTFNLARATSAELAATRTLSGVTAAAGPFREATISPEQGGYPLGPMTVVGRANPLGPVDDVTLESGRWPTQAGQIVMASDPAPGETVMMPLGSRISLTGKPGSPQLTIVGFANSVTSTAAGWVAPAEISALTAAGAQPSTEMLYRFANAGTTAEIRSDVAAVGATLPRGAIAGVQSYLTVKAQETGNVAPFVPFLVAFGVIGLVMSVLIVANVVSGAVVAGYRRIGILKSIGFTPGQVVAAYTGQVSVPAVVGCLGGVVLGNLLAVPLLVKTAQVYGSGRLTVPVWVDVAVPVAMLVLVGVAALVPAARAGRMGAVQAIAAGRAPRAGGGYTAHRVLGRLPLPRPVTVGLAAPFARPARTAGTLVAILLGATAVTFAVGLSASLGLVVTGLSHDKAEPVQVSLSASNSIGPAQQQAITAALRAQPGTQHVVAEADDAGVVAGLSRQVDITAFAGNGSWTGYDMISGHWYSKPGQVDVGTGFLTETGKSVGDTVTMTINGRSIPVQIAGEVFDSDNRGMDLITSTQTVAAAGPSQTVPSQYDVGLRPGYSAAGYAQGLQTRLGDSYFAQVNSRKSVVIDLMEAIIGMLTLMLTVVAGLGVLNMIVMNTRERVHDLGVFKAIGMTPRQTIVMVVCWVAGTGLVAGLLAVPAGIEVHRYVLPIMASAADLTLPHSFLSVYGAWQLAGLALAGVAIAVLGALLPAGWAAGIRTATALRAE
jgi:putative ABC transport system permease protein